MVILLFWLDDKNWKTRFFEETILLADISIDIAFGIFFLILRNVGINLNDCKLG